jgi:tetratricopeptide (TPR) repeat protein
VLVAAGDLSSARQRYEAALAILQRLSDSNPTSAAALRDVSVSLSQLGDVLVAAGDLSSARQRYEAALAIRQRLSDSNPTSAEARRDLLVGHVKMFVVSESLEHLRAAHRIAEELAGQGKLAPRDARMLETLRKAVAELPADGP